MRLRRSAWFFLPLASLLFIGMYWVGQSQWVGRSLEAALSTLLGTPVEVSGARLDLITLQARVARLRVADRRHPSRWAFEAGPAMMDVRFWPLLEGKLVIDRLTLSGVTGGGERTVPPVTPPIHISTASQPVSDDRPARLRAALPRLDLSLLARRLDLDALLADHPLASQAWADEQARRWRERLAAARGQVESLGALEDELSELRARLESMDLQTRDPRRLREELTTLRGLRDRLRALRERIRETEEGLRETLNFPRDREGLAAARQTDLALLERVAGLDLGRVADALFGVPVVERLAALLGYLGMARTLLAQEAEAPPPPPRRAGRDFVFPADPPVPPRLLLVAGRVAGEWPGRGPFELRLAHLSSAPHTWHRPVAVELALGRDHPWWFEGTLDHRRGRDVDHIQLRGKGLVFPDLPLHTPAEQPLPRAVSLDETQLSGRLVQRDGRLEGRLELTAGQVRFHFPAPTEVASAYRTVYPELRRLFEEETARLRLDITVSGTLDAPRLRLASSLDQALTARLQALLGKRLQRARARLRQRLDEQVDARLDEARTRLEGEAAGLQAQLGQWQERIDELDGLVERRRRALQSYLEAEMKAAGKRLEQDLKREAGKALRGLGL